jgi:hypothetical protein
MFIVSLAVPFLSSTKFLILFIFSIIIWQRAMFEYCMPLLFFQTSFLNIDSSCTAFLIPMPVSKGMCYKPSLMLTSVSNLPNGKLMFRLWGFNYTVVHPNASWSKFAWVLVLTNYYSSVCKH